MTGVIKIVERALSFLATEWKTKKGLLVIQLLMISMFLYFGFYSSFETIGFSVSIMIAVLCAWFLMSGRVIFPSHSRKTVILCFDVENEADKNFRRTISQLNRRLADLDLRKQVRFKLVASDLIPDRPTAHRYRERYGVDIVVWGKVFHGKENDHTVTKFELNHTVVLTPAIKQNLRLFIADLSLMLSKRKWSISETNDLLDLKEVASEFFETCLVIVGIYFYEDGKFQDGIKVLESVLQSNSKTILSKEQILQANRVRAILYGLYLNQAQIENNLGNQTSAIKLLDKIPKEHVNRVSALMVLARAHYSSGNLLGAQQCTNEIRMIEKDHPAVAFNYAFFGIVQKNYERTRFWYDQLLKLKEIKDVDVFSVITFLDEEYAKVPAEHAFRYALGVVNGYVDPEARRKELNRFLRSTISRPEYEVLRRRAIELLETRDTTKSGRRRRKPRK